MAVQTPFKIFSAEEHAVWCDLYLELGKFREKAMVPQFQIGLDALGVNGTRIPDFDDVTSKLRQLTGFTLVPVNGFEMSDDFFCYLARREFPVANFIRQADQAGYKALADVFHDLYGHVPFLAWPEYADFCCAFGNLASKFKTQAAIISQLECLFWITIEFGMVSTPQGMKVLGSGIASSLSECIYATSDRADIVPFELNRSRFMKYKVDDPQPKLVLLESPQSLFGCLGELEELFHAKECG